MDSPSEQILVHLIHNTRIAALGTLHDGEPNLAMVAVAFESDFSSFYLHVSKLGKHTADMEKNPQVSLLLTETDDHRADPQTLARLSLQGTAEKVTKTDSRYERVRNIYLKRFPEAEKLFSLGDFSLWRISPKAGRFVAGFGQAFNIEPKDLHKVANL
jgi:putative heme iron utilization protein